MSRPGGPLPVVDIHDLPRQTINAFRALAKIDVIMDRRRAFLRGGVWCSGRRPAAHIQKSVSSAIVISKYCSILGPSGFGQTILHSLSPLARRLVTPSPEHRSIAAATESPQRGYAAASELIFHLRPWTDRGCTGGPTARDFGWRRPRGRCCLNLILEGKGVTAGGQGTATRKPRGEKAEESEIGERPH